MPVSPCYSPHEAVSVGGGTARTTAGGGRMEYIEIAATSGGNDDGVYIGPPG